MEHRELGGAVGVATVINGAISAGVASIPVIGGLSAPILGAVLVVAGAKVAMTKTIANLAIGAGAVLTGASLFGINPLGGLGVGLAALGVVLNFSHVFKGVPVVGQYIAKLG
jgi:hypothetical protein